MSSEKKVLTLEHLPTIRKLFTNGVIQQSEDVDESIKPNDKLLDKVAF